MAVTAVGLKTHIYNNNAKSALLLAGFPILVMGMVCTFFAAMYKLKVILPGMKNIPLDKNIPFIDILAYSWEDTLSSLPMIFLCVGIWFVIAYFIHSKMIHASTGSMAASRKDYPKIYNMLENLCIERGIMMPQLRVIDSPALNAFASGINQKTYAITLTRGIIDTLEDDELNAVLAHELTHILNRDVRLLIISVIFVGIISFLAEMIFRILVHGRGGRRYRYKNSSGNDKKGGHMVILLVALAVLVIGYIFAIVIRFALSRKREYLADAGAVELTKNPEAMMKAPMRISGKDVVKDMPDEVQQMCIENSYGFMGGIFATHPSIDDRIDTISKMTNTPVPALNISLKRPPKRPWG